MKRTDRELFQLVMEKLNGDGFSRGLGLRVTEVDRGYAVARMPFDERHTNLFGMAHGGAIFSLADQAAAAAGASLGKPAVAINMSINYLKTPAIGEELVAEARVISHSNKIGWSEVEVKDGSGQVIAKSTQMIYRLDKSFDEMFKGV